MKKIISIYFMLNLFVFLLCKNACPWDNVKTHRDLSKYAADNSILSKNKGDYLRNLGFVKGLDQIIIWNNAGLDVRKWLQEGAFLEDEGSYWDAIAGTARYSNHFHNPLRLWESAGLSDLQSGESIVLWAQDTTKQGNSLGGDRSWQKVRLCYYNALTVQTAADRQAFFACTFEGLGYQMHLIEDMSVPSHTRNDAHPLDSLVGTNFETGDYYLETWAKKNDTKIDYYASSPVFPQVALNINPNGRLPIAQFIDSEQYDGSMPSTNLTWGLAEYTNSNFVSDDTIFTESRDVNNKHYFPFPRYSSMSYEMYEIDQSLITKRIYLNKRGDGEQIDHFATAGPLFRWLSFDPVLQKTELKLDSAVFKDYTQKLIPRAVGYSAALLDYFFRGSIAISAPSNGLYSMIDPTKPGFNPATAAFTSLKLKATNTTSTGENMTNGAIQLVVKYKVAHADPFQPGPVEKDTDFTYIVVPEKNNVSALYSATPTELNFDLGQGIPLRATDVYMQVVFKGTLGNEENAVAVGFKDISEPTPIDIFNNMDKICINGSWYNAGSPKAIAQVDANHDGIAGTDEADVYAYDLQNIYLRFSPYSQDSPYFFASPSTYDIHVSYLSAGAPVRAVYLLSDYMFNKGQYLTWVNTDNNDPWYHPDVNWLWWFSAVKRQLDYSEDSALCGGSPPCYVDVYPIAIPTFSHDNILGFHTFRNTSMWWGSAEIWINTPVPSTSSCSYDSL